MRSLQARLALLAAGVALLTALLAGLIGAGLLRRADTSGAQQSLARVADQLADDSDAGAVRGRVALRALKVNGAVIARDGTVTGTRLGEDALTPTDVSRVLAGQVISRSERVDGTAVLVEARPTTSGGIVVVQRRADAVSLIDRVRQRLLVGLLVAIAVSAVIGVLVARRLARPLRRAASAAHALAGGDRAVSVPVEGPSEVAEVATAVNVLAGALGASEARQRDFLLSVSHDLRTPLTAITGYAESLADGVVEGDEVRRVGTVVAGEAHRLERLVADLLDLARLEAQDPRVDLRPTPIDPLLQALGEVWADRCARVGVDFAVRREAADVVVRTDPLRLRQVLDGLLENALRVTAAGRPIVVELSRGADAAALEVRDGGPGLTDDDLRVAFDRSALYDRYRGVRQVGTGLGLAIVHRLCELVGARVSAGHAPEGGASFRVELPYQT